MHDMTADQERARERENIRRAAADARRDGEHDSTDGVLGLLEQLVYAVCNLAETLDSRQ